MNDKKQIPIADTLDDLAAWHEIYAEWYKAYTATQALDDDSGSNPPGPPPAPPGTGGGHS